MSMSPETAPPSGGLGAALPCSFFDRPVVEVAHDLLGCTFLFAGVGGRIVEVEAYRADDPASHAHRGRTARNSVLFGPPGRLYVYFTQGRHHCVNLVCQAEGEAAGVLLRALEPTHGLEVMRRRRGVQRVKGLCSGPARLTQALGIDRRFNGVSLCSPPVAVLPRQGCRAGDASCWSLRPPRTIATPRIGVSRGVETLWRFVDADSSCLSRPLPRARGG